MPVSTRSSSGPKSNANSKEHAKTTRSAAQRVAPKPTQPKHNSSTYKSSSSKKINTTAPVPQNESPEPTTSLNPAQFLDSSGAGETLGFWTTFKEFMPSAERTCQFYGGECSFDLDGMADGTCMLLSPKIRVMSPFKSPGKIEVKSGANGLGSGSIRITRWKLRVTFQSNFEEKYLIPFRHIEQIIVTTHFSPHQVIIIPSAATGVSPLLRQYPQAIQFEWPDKNATSGLQGQVGDLADRKTDTFLSILKDVFDEQLGPFDREVVVEGVETEDQFRCHGVLTRVPSTPMNEPKAGSLMFLPTGLLWLEHRVLYFPLTSFDKKMSLLFCRETTSRDKTIKSPAPIVAMGLMFTATEPFYEAHGTKTGTRLIRFNDIWGSPRGDWASRLADIEDYARRHELKLDKLQQTYHDYHMKQLMPGLTGFEPFQED